MKTGLKRLIAGVLLAPAAAMAEVTNITNAQLAGMNAENVTIIDVRRPDEWRHTGTIEGSHPIMFFDRNGSYDVRAWLDQLSEVVDKDQPIALICAAGVRSSSIANLLDKRLGFSAVFNVTEGMNQWVAEKRPVVKWPAQ